MYMCVGFIVLVSFGGKSSGCKWGGQPTVYVPVITYMEYKLAKATHTEIHIFFLLLLYSGLSHLEVYFKTSVHWPFLLTS